MKKYKSKINEPKFYDILSIPSNPEDLFTLLYPIGNGGFGKVYKAIHNSSKQIYSIKIVDYTKEILMIKVIIVLIIILFNKKPP